MTTVILERNNLPLVENAQLDAQMAKLAAAAEVGDIRSFRMACEEIDWSARSPEEFIQAARMALAAGAQITARKIATIGAEKHPYHQELQKYRRVLASPKLIRSDIPADRAEIELDRQWLLTHRQHYLGRWVALQRGVLLAVADSFTELTNRVSVQEDILFTKVY